MQAIQLKLKKLMIA